MGASADKYGAIRRGVVMDTDISALVLVPIVGAILYDFVKGMRVKSNVNEVDRKVNGVIKTQGECISCFKEILNGMKEQTALMRENAVSHLGLLNQIVTELQRQGDRHERER